jgi:ADP-ribosylglycohydrolase
VELTVWPAYALGGGRATRAATLNLTRNGTTWSTNFYKGWSEAGGNGVAMRIQPHVFATGDYESSEWLTAILRNGVATHGHPRALVGAVVHALALAYALEHGASPGPAEWGLILERSRSVWRLFDDDLELATYWKPRWEKASGGNLEDSWLRTVAELATHLSVGQNTAPGADLDEVVRLYDAAIEALELRSSSSRGSGTTTVAASILLAWFANSNPELVGMTSALALDTDTDTIGSMAAAIAGAANPSELKLPLLDVDYLKAESRRLAGLSLDQKADDFPYPDVARWQPPRNQLEVVGLTSGGPAIAGLGPIVWTGEHYESGEEVWSWAGTPWGQSVLIKHRRQLPDLPSTRLPRHTDVARGPVPSSDASTVVRPGRLSDQEVSGVDVDAIFDWLEKQRFSDESLGFAVRRVSESGTAVDLGILAGLIRARFAGR